MYEHKSFVIENGLKIVVIPRLVSRSAGLSLCGFAGSGVEREMDIGVAHFLEHLVLRGSKKFPSKDTFASVLEDRGASFNARTNQGFVEFSAKVLKEDIEKGFEFLSQLFIYPLLSKEDIEKEKDIIIQESRRIEGNDEKRLFRHVMGGLYTNSRFKKSVVGEEEDIAKIDHEKITYFFKKYYNANNFVLSVFGDFDVSFIQQLAKKYFNTAPSGKLAEMTSPMVNKKGSVSLIDNKETKQGHIMIGYPAFSAVSDKIYATELLALILGSTSLSRLYNTIRGEHALAYRVVSNSINYYHFGSFVTYAGVDSNHINEVLKYVYAQLLDVSNNLVSDEEFARAKALMKSRLVFSYDNVIQTASWYGVRLLYRQSAIHDYDTEINNFEKVTREDIREVANVIFSEKPSIAIMSNNPTQKNIDVSIFGI